MSASNGPARPNGVTKPTRGITLGKALTLLKKMHKAKKTQHLVTIMRHFKNGDLPHHRGAYELISLCARNVGLTAIQVKYATMAYFVDPSQPPSMPDLDLSRVPEELEGVDLPPLPGQEVGVKEEKKEEDEIEQVEEEDLIPDDVVDFEGKLQAILQGADPIYELMLSHRSAPVYEVKVDKENRTLHASCSMVLECRNITLPGAHVPRQVTLQAMTRYRRGDAIDEGSVMYRRAVNRVAREALAELAEIRANVRQAAGERWQAALENRLDLWRTRKYTEACAQAFRNVKNIILSDHFAGLYGAKVFMFGSATTGMAMSGSDVDVTVVVPKVDRPKGVEGTNLQQKSKIINILFYLEEWAKKAKMQDVYVVDTAKVPLLRYRDVDAEIDVDISISNDHGVLLSRFIRRHLQVDARIWELCMAIKFWAKRRAVSGTPEGYINPIGWTIMAIFFLQHVASPPIAGLFRIKGKKSNTSTIVRVPWRSSSRNGQSEEKTYVLLTKFFQFYGEEFDFSKHAISLNCHDFNDAADLRQKRGRSEVYIEQPMEFGANVVDHVSRSTLQETRRELRMAYANCVALGDANAVFAERELPERDLLFT